MQRATVLANLRLPVMLPVAILTVACGASPLPPTGETVQGCEETREDLEFRCPYRPVSEADDVLLSQGLALFSAKIDGSGEKNLVLYAPAGWTILQSSIAPNRERILLAMVKGSCPAWPDPSGRTCGWRRVVLFAAYPDRGASADPNDDSWVVFGLAPIYGYNADVHGWTSWQSNKYALFNALVRPENQPLFTERQEDNTAQAYQIRFDSDRDVQINLWGPGIVSLPACLNGRLYPSHVENQDAPVDGALVVFARRCYDELKTDQSFAWWNTSNVDGSGGKCVADLPSLHVPVLRTFVVETDAQGQPISMPRLVKQPRADGLFRHIAKAVPEWGDMQPTISQDGAMIAVHTVKGYDDSAPLDNCGSFRYGGRGAPRVFVCRLDPDGVCADGLVQMPPGERIRSDQGQPFFYEYGGNRFVLMTESEEETGRVFLVRVDLEEPFGRSVLFEGIGGYPLTKR